MSSGLEIPGPAPRANAGSRRGRPFACSQFLRAIGADAPRRSRWPAYGGPSRERPYRHFAEINRAALAAFPAVLARLLPGGKIVGLELVALNPRRSDPSLGSFKVNRYGGRWADFATGDKGGDPISLVAYLGSVSQGEAARMLARMLGIETGGRRRG
jgi:hypothetical protein